MRRSSYLAIIAVLLVTILLCAFVGCEQTTGDGQTTEDGGQTTVCYHVSLTHHYAVEATCTKDGNIEYWTCDECGKYFADAYCKSEITAQHTIVDAKGHNLNYTAAIEATCTTGGNIEYWTCSKCEKYFADADGNKEITFEQTLLGPQGHTFSGALCTVCGVKEPTRGLEYILNSDGKSYCVSGIGTATDKDIVIADIYEGLPVTEIGYRAFYNTEITSVTIPNSVTSIEQDTFSNCTSLTRVVIPDSVTSIGILAFNKCSSLTSIGIPDSVTSIGDSAFSGCTSLTGIVIPDSVTIIGEWAFANCTLLTNIEIPDSVTSIGNYVFYKCTGLTNIVIPDSVTSIGWYAFENCDNLTIYCEATSKPSGWDSNWNYSNCPVVWGYTG